MKALTLFAIALAVNTTAELAASEPTAAPDEVFSIQTLDEVVVSGKLTTLSGLQKAILESEDRFYDRYNELNQDRLLDIECHHEAPTGSNLKHRSCLPKAVHAATRAEAMQLFRAGGGNIRIQPVSDIAATLQPEMRKRTLKMLEQDAELRQALLEHARLKQMYADLYAKKREGQWIVWD